MEFGLYFLWFTKSRGSKRNKSISKLIREESYIRYSKIYCYRSLNSYFATLLSKALLSEEIKWVRYQNISIVECSHFLIILLSIYLIHIFLINIMPNSFLLHFYLLLFSAIQIDYVVLWFYWIIILHVNWVK